MTPEDVCVCGDLRRYHAPGGGPCELCAANAALFGGDVQPRCEAFREAEAP